jgi:hypothetical protein
MMPSHVTGADVALIVDVVSSATLFIRLYSQGLIKQYPFLASLVLSLLIQGIVLLPVKSHSTYADLYYISVPILWILYYGVVLELYRLILEDYPGISSAGRKAVTWAMGVAVFLSVVLGALTIDISATKFWQLRIFFSVERSVMLGLLLFLILIQLFLFRYRLNLSRNRVIYSVGYALFFGFSVVSDIVLPALFGTANIYVPLTAAVGITGSLFLFAGSFLLSRQGEARRDQLDPGDNSPERERLQQQLVEMNRMLSRVARGG